MNLCWFVVYIGTGIASASWVFLLCGIIFLVSGQILGAAEERGCLETFGDSYREYINRTPKWIGIPKG
jgi:protein-S-isoprenylcysteine O-methyltransferase Ste14